MKKKAVGYLRISSERQINGESPETQKAAIEQYAAANDIDVVEYFYDEAKSGKNTERKELQNMFGYIKKHKGQINHVIVYKINRASREMISFVTGFLVPLNQLNVTLRSATELVDETTFGVFSMGLNLLIGQMENSTKRDFTIDNMRSLASQGYWQSAPMLGYKTHKIKNELGKTRSTLKPDHKAPLIKQVLERYSQGDINKAELTRFAAGIGLRSQNGKILSEDSINRLIKNPIYAGYIKGNLTDWELVPGKHEAIISEQIFEMNQRLINGKKKRIGEEHLKLNPDYPLKGLILCNHCEKPLYASAPRTGAGGTSPRYHCARATCKGKTKSVKADVVHQEFAEMLKRIKPSEEMLLLYREVLVSEAAKHLGNLNNKISKVRSDLDVVAQSRLTAIKNVNKGTISKEEKTELIASLEDDKEKLHEELGRLEKLQSIRETDIDLAVTIMKDVDLQWQIAPLSAQVRFQSLIFPSGVKYNPETNEFGTNNISPLYQSLRYKKIPGNKPGTSTTNLVAGVGLEPTTSWL